MSTGSLTGSYPTPRPAPKVIHRCPRCFAELFEADNGYGGVRLACPTHGWDRYPIVTVPASVEEDCKRHPDLATRWLGWLLNRDFSWPADDAPESDTPTLASGPTLEEE